MWQKCYYIYHRKQDNFLQIYKQILSLTFMSKALFGPLYNVKKIFYHDCLHMNLQTEVLVLITAVYLQEIKISY